MPNFLSACRRVADWAKPLANSSNLSFMAFLSFALLVYWAHTCASEPTRGSRAFLKNSQKNAH
jgi:hypothetical protein